NSSHDRAALLGLDLETADVIREIDTGAGSAALPNGLSAPTGVFGPDGRTLAYVYVRDALGNVWKFDLTGEPGDWFATRMFTGTAGGVAQPISGGLTVAIHPTTNRRWVFFGTGRYLTNGDVTNTATQTMYGFVDDGTVL